MVIKPRIMNNVCLTAHPVGLYKTVEEQIAYVKKQGPFTMPKKILILGGSTGYGLATRISAAFGGNADTISVSFEKEPTINRTGTPGWYNNAAFKIEAEKTGYLAENINGDAFSHEIRQETIEKIKEHFGKIDMLVYSLASPVRKDPYSDTLYKSVLKPIGQAYTAHSVNFLTEQISEMEILPAEQEEIDATVKVMGGEDWKLWIAALRDAGVLEEGFTTLAYSYIGPEMTFPIYRGGTIGLAKEHLEKTALELDDELKALGGRAFISVNKALVTRASAMIPVIPLYISLLFRIMKVKGTHEGCIEQMYRMLSGKIYGTEGLILDKNHLLRMDDWEMEEEVQNKVKNLWEQVDESNIRELTDIVDYRREYMKLHGFEVDGVNYDANVRLGFPCVVC